MKKYLVASTSAALGLTAMFGATPVSATEQIAYMLFGDPAYQTKCDVCHTNANINTADKGNLMPAARTAYNQDKWGLSGLKTFVASASAPATPTCVAPQVLNPAKTACITPAPTVPTCVSPQVLNAAKTACETPVVTPITTPTTTIVSCTAPQVLDTATNTCITTTIDTTMGGQSAGVSVTNTKPVLNAVTSQWDVKVGEKLVIPLSVNDAEHDEFKMTGNVAGSKFSAVYTDAKSLLPTVDFQWTPTAAQVNKTFSISFVAKETNTTEKYASNKVPVKIRVWPADNTSAISPVSKLNISTASWKAGKLKLTGNVTFNKTVTSAEIKNFIATPTNLTVISGKDPKTGTMITTTPLTLNAKGSWTVTLAIPQAQVPCEITLQYEGQNAGRTVTGAPAAACSKIVSSTSTTTSPLVQFAKNERGDGNDSAHNDEHDGHDSHHDDHDD